jgi:monoamine oxidase
VTVFEARMRCGGRIHTLRDEFGDGLYAEAGAMDFGDAYVLLQQYIQLFGLRTTAEAATQKAHVGNDVYYLQHKRYVVPSGKDPDWPYTLSAEERKLGLQGLWDKYIGPIASRMGKPSTFGWPNSTEQELNGTTLNELLRKQGASDGVISVLRMTFLGEDFDHVSALQDLIWQPFFDANHKWSQLDGGNDRLPKAFAERLGQRVRYGSVLQKVAQDEKKVQLSISRGGSVEQVEASRVVIAIPFSVLRNVEMDNSFSQEKRAAISKLRYESASHIYLQSRTRFWDEQGISGFATTDLPIRSILDLTQDQHGPRAILATEMEGNQSRRVAGMKPDERISWCLENVTRVFPEMAANFEGGTSVVWDDEPWSMGAGAYFAPGEMTTMFPHVATPEGRVHFAGEHTSWLYLMEGAAQSGRRVASEINSSV